MSEAFVLKSETRRQQVADHLRREIVSGRRAPGSPLREVELSTSLGVSRGPIREALRELEKEGLVEVRPYAATTVARVSIEALIEVYELRSALEKKAFELLWSGRDVAYEAEFRRRHDALVAAVRSADGRQIVEAELHFHAYPYERCGNGLILRTWEQMSQRMQLTFLLHSGMFAAHGSYAEAHVPYLRAALGASLDDMLAEVDRHLAVGMELIRKKMLAAE
jgi:DNA-binding GntR family transcriptional regulator